MSDVVTPCVFDSAELEIALMGRTLIAADMVANAASAKPGCGELVANSPCEIPSATRIRRANAP